MRPDDFTIEFMIDTDPATTIYQMTTVFSVSGVPLTRTNSGLQLLGRTLFSYTADLTLANVELQENQRYYLTIYNNTTDGRWSIAADNSSGRAFFDNDGRDSISSFGGSLDFRLFGTAVPEPGLGAVLLYAGFCLSWRRQRN